MSNEPLRVAECMQYFAENSPSPEILERFAQTLSDWEVMHPLYCEKSDTISGFVRLAFTIAIAHDLSDEPSGGFEERYCFEDPLVGMEELIAWHKREYDDMRPAGWVAVRKISSSKAFIASFEKHYSKDYGRELLPYATHESVDFPAHFAIVANTAVIQEKLGYSPNKVKHLASYLKYSRQVE